MAYVLTPISDLDNLLAGWIDNGDGTYDSNELNIDAVAKTFYFKGAGNFVSPGSGVTGQALYSFFKDRWKNVASLTKFDFPMLSITNEQFEFIDGWKPAETPVYQLIDAARSFDVLVGASIGQNSVEISKLEAADFGSNEAITLDGGDGTFYTITNIDLSGTNAVVYFSPDATEAIATGVTNVDVYFKSSTRKMLRTAGWAEADATGNVSRRYSGIITLGSMGLIDQPYFTQNNLTEMTVRGTRVIGGVYDKFDAVLDANTGVWFWNSNITGTSNGLGVMPDYSFDVIAADGGLGTNTITLTQDPNYPTDATMATGGLVGMQVTIKGVTDAGTYFVSGYDNATKVVTLTVDPTLTTPASWTATMVGGFIFGLVDFGVSWYPLTLDTTYTGPVNEPVQIFGTTQFGDQFANNGSAEADFKMYVRERAKLYADADLQDIGVSSMTYIVYRFPLSNAADLKLETTLDTELDSNTDGVSDVGPYSTINVTNLDAQILGAWSATTYVQNDVVQGTDGRWYLNAVPSATISSGDASSLAATFTANATPTVAIELTADIKYGDTVASLTSVTGLSVGTYIELPGHSIRYKITDITALDVTFTPGFHLNLATGFADTVNQFDLAGTGSDLAGNVYFPFHGEREVETGTFSAYKTIVDANTSGIVAGATKEQVYDWAQWGLRQSSTVDTRFAAGAEIPNIDIPNATAGDTSIILGTGDGLNFSVGDFIGIPGQGTIYEITNIATDTITFTPALQSDMTASTITVTKYSKIDGTINGNIADTLAYFVGDTLHTSAGVFVDDIAAADTNNIVFHDYANSTHLYPLTVLVNINFNSNLVSDGDAVFYAYYKDILITDATITAATNIISKAVDSGYAVDELVGQTVTISGATAGGDNGTRTITANTSSSITVDGTAFTNTETITLDVVGDEFGTPGALQVVKADTTLVGADASNNIATAEVSGSYSFNYAYDVDTTGGRTTGTDTEIVVVAIGLNTGQYVSAEGSITTAGANISLVAPLERNYSNPA